MSKGILLIIKIIITIVVITIMAGAKQMGVPVAIKSLIGLGIIYAVWKYKPNKLRNDNDNQLNKH